LREETGDVTLAIGGGKLIEGSFEVGIWAGGEVEGLWRLLRLVGQVDESE
jgi:hypothetical protein